jgi:hypothetical protein
LVESAVSFADTNLGAEKNVATKAEIRKILLSTKGIKRNYK